MVTAEHRSPHTLRSEREWGDDDPFAPPPEARPHRRVLRALRISAWTAGLLTITGALALAVYLDRGDPPRSARAIEREIEFVLERGEVVERRVPVTRRHWWHFFRVSHGALIATDRRVLYIGVPPASLLHRDAGPAETDVRAWSYAEGLAVARSRALPGRPAAVHLAGAGGSEMLLLAGRDLRQADTLFALVGRHLEELRATREAERRAVEAARDAARRAIYHQVRPGESLTLLAVRYGANIDSLRAWNGLTTDRIAAGQRLLVKPER